MSINMYTELTNAQLKEECVALNIKVIAKGKTPNKGEYLGAIEAFYTDQEAPSIEEFKKEVEEVAEEIKTTRKPQSPMKLARLDMLRKDRVIVHDTQESQTKDKDEILPVSWGNRILKGQDFVALNGQPQYIRRGAIKNLLDATTVNHVPKASGGVLSEIGKRFVVTEVAGLTADELAELATKQRMRNSKYA